MLNTNHYFFLVIVTLMMSVSLLATDIYLPALPEMTEYFNCSQTDIQRSFTVFLIGLAGCQLISGMLSDKFGRKRVVVIGFTVFTISSVLCAHSSNLAELNTCRLLQAIGGGVGSVVGRALVVDRFNRDGSVKIFSTIFPVIGLSAAVGPLIGGYLTYYWGWRSPFIFIASFGFLVLLMAISCLKDVKKNPVITLETETMDLLPINESKLGYLAIIRNLEFLGYALIICAGFCVFRCYTVESPFVFNSQGYGAEEIGHFYIVLSLSYLSGNLIARKLANSLKVSQLLAIGFSFFVSGGFCMVCASYLFSSSPYSVIIPMSLVTLGNGFLFPVGSASALTSVPSHLTGSASGLMGAMQFVFAALCINWVGEFSQGQALPMSIFIAGIILLGYCNYLFFVVYKTKPRVTAT